MTQKDLLKLIAETGYNVGFGAKKHFATFDIVTKVPGFIGFASTAVGVFALFMECLSTKHLSAAFIVLGVMGLYISNYDHKKHTYDEAGKKLIKLFDRLKELYFSVKASEEVDLSQYQEELRSIKEDYDKCGISEQILCSDWYAHYKFFWQHQIDWVDEQKQFRFFRDKIPLSLFALIAAVLTVFMVVHYTCKSAPPSTPTPPSQSVLPAAPSKEATAPTKGSPQPKAPTIAPASGDTTKDQ